LLGISRPNLYSLMQDSLMQAHGLETDLAKGNDTVEELVGGLVPARPTPPTGADDMLDRN